MITSQRRKSYEESLARLNLFPLSLERKTAPSNNYLSVLEHLKGLGTWMEVSGSHVAAHHVQRAMGKN